MKSPNLSLVSQKPNRATSTSVDTLEVTEQVIGRWKAPPFQRPLKVNEKVRGLAAMISETGVLPGMLTLGVLDGVTYLMDGQHRVEAFRMACIPVAFADVRVHHVKTMGEMGDEFIALNSALVRFTPDDILRGMEAGSDALRIIRTKCAFVGYDQIRRGPNSPVLSMSMLLRCWVGSAGEVPLRDGTGIARLAEQMGVADAETLAEFTTMAFAAWGRDAVSSRLWSSLNLCVCMWIYRRVVLAQWSTRIPKMARSMFQKCLMSLAASESYTDWLVGRSNPNRDRSPCYSRIATIMKSRIESETGTKPLLPSPTWANTHRVA